VSDNQPTDYDAKDAREQHARWVKEFAAARKALEPWQKKGDDIDAEFRNEIKTQGDLDSRLPLFTSDVQTMIAMLYGQVPLCDVSRRYGDADDDLARVAGEILERCLNTDTTRTDDTYAVALGCVLMDFFLPGFGQASCRYVTGEIQKKALEGVLDEKGEQAYEESRPQEDVEIDYTHWKDWLWGPAKVPHQIPWWSRSVDMSRAQLVERFGPLGKLVPLKKGEDGEEDPWSRAKVHEICEKSTRRVYWFCETFNQCLDMKDDPFGLEGFYPFPAEPLMANLTTSKVVPRPYYALHQDQYRQINSLMSRIRELVEAVRAGGICDKEQWEHINRVLLPENRNKLIPVPNWMKVMDAGGIKGLVDWFPVEPVVAAIGVLQQQLISEIDLLHQTTGFSDILRGEATQAGATATEVRGKTKAGSVRAQRMQDEIARWATDLLRIKGEIVCKQFAPETIYERANVRFMSEADQAIAMQAIALLKTDYACYRIEVKPENVALADFASMKQERTEFLGALTTYFQAMAPIVQAMPDAMEDLLDVGAWVAAGIRGSSQIEGVFDRMRAKAKAAAEARKNNPQQAPPDPKVQAEQMKQQTVAMQGQQKMQAEEFKLKANLVQGQAEVQNDAMREENQRRSNVQEFAQRQMISAATKPPPVAPKPGGIPR
jgi:hypothetical protein